MAKASQVVLLENEFYLIKAPNGKVLEIKNFNTENGAAIRLWDYAGHPWQQWQFVDAGEGRWRIKTALQASSSIWPWAAWSRAPGCTSGAAPAG